MPTVAETILNLYNDALAFCEERPLKSITEPRKPRYLLDNVYNGGGVNACLEEADWGFARRTTQMDSDPGIQPSFGYIHAFAHPEDWLRTSQIASDPYFQSPLTQYADEGGYWFADLDQIYIKYVSSDPNFGGNMALWSEAFKQFAAVHFASKIVGMITHSQDIKDRVMLARERLVMAARGKDGMNEPPGFFPRGQLSRARQGLYFGRPDRQGSGWY